MFFCGEPLLEFELIKQIVNYVESETPSNIKKEYLITTNGTLVNEEIQKFLAEKNLLLQ